MSWAAIIVFASSTACGDYVDAHGLMQQHPAQCVLIEEDYAHLETIRRPAPRPPRDLAPITSPRPQPRPTSGEQP